MMPVKKAIFVIVIAIVAYNTILLCIGQEPAKDSRCMGCHEDVISRGDIYIHKPFSEQRCSFCHVPAEGERDLSAMIDERHEDGLRSRHDTGVNVCYRCHSQERLGVSHPVGVYPNKKMRIPEGLPTGRGGRLLCITCHEPHGSDEAFLGRRPVSIELCIACHGEGYLK